MVAGRGSWVGVHTHVAADAGVGQEIAASTKAMATGYLNRMILLVW
jgi:hypothetical protein